MLGLVAFNDIGKPAKDLLSKDYPFGSVKVEVKTTAPNGVVCVLHNDAGSMGYLTTEVCLYI